MKGKFKLATLGCRTNQYETEAYAAQLRSMGYQEAKEGEKADICIVNTCTVTESADRHSRHQIRQFAREHQGSKLIVTGCLAERKPKELQQIGGVTDVVPNRQKEELLNLIFPQEQWPEFAIDQFSGHTRAFVKVQDGCNSFCTYCIIPYVRGRSRSRPVEEIIREIETLIEQGYQEIVLTGINIGDFCGDQGESLADLVRIVDQIPGLKRMRLSSIDPDEVDTHLEEAILTGKTTAPSMHIVLQAGSNMTLKRMNRKYTRQIFLETVERLRKRSPRFTVTTDIIVGFPGETETDFEETLEVMRQVKFAKVHMFPYSRRERTRAALYPNHLPMEVIQERKQKVLREAEQLAFELRQDYVGQTVAVLMENKGTGHTDNFLPVEVETTEDLQNQFVLVKCLENRPQALFGKVVGCLSP